MTISKIVGFGDSWMYGDELLDPALQQVIPQIDFCSHLNDAYRNSQCFLGLLGQHYGVPVQNFGIPGGSLQSEIWTLLWWLQQEPHPQECLVLVGHTNPARMSWYDRKHQSFDNDPPWNKFVHTAWTDAMDHVVSPAWKDLNKKFIVMATGPEFEQLNWMQTVMLFDGIAARQGIAMLQFQISPLMFTPMLHIPTVIWPDRNLKTWFLHRPENAPGRRELWHPNQHPNEQGHRLIRDMLIPEIDRAILQR